LNEGEDNSIEFSNKLTDMIITKIPYKEISMELEKALSMPSVLLAIDGAHSIDQSFSWSVFPKPSGIPHFLM